MSTASRPLLLVATLAVALASLGACVPAVAVEREYAWPASWSVTTGAWVCPSTPLEPRFEPTLYVATDGDDGASGRSPDAALRTLARAAKVATSGDVVWVREGVYSADVAFRSSGTAAAPIVFESYPGECAVLDGSGLGPLERPRFESVRHVVFRNFVVRNSPAEGLFLSRSHDVVIANVRVHDNALSGILSLGGDRNVFSHVISHDNVDQPSGDNADGISISSGDGNRVERCLAFRNSDDGIDTWRSTNTVVERCAAFDNGVGGGDGNGIKAGGGRVMVRTVVRFNVAFGNRSDGFDANSGQGVRFEQNTAYGNGRFGFVLSGGVARNNLAVDNRLGAVGRDTSNALQEENSWNRGDFGATVFASVDPADPRFLALATASPVAGAGALAGGRALVDLLGTEPMPFVRARGEAAP